MNGCADASALCDGRLLRVLKLGGSLLDLPDLPGRFNRYLNFLHARGPCCVLVVVGGGVAADAVRDHDSRFALGEARGHELAVRAMSFNAHCMSHILPGAVLAGSVNHAQEIWRHQPGAAAVIEPVAWLEDLEQQGLAIQRVWQFTSDSIAAAIAGHLKAEALTLLKSTMPTVRTVHEAIAAGLVDRCFAHACSSVARVEVVNLRSENCLAHELARD